MKLRNYIWLFILTASLFACQNNYNMELYNINVQDRKGAEVSLADYKGKVLLIVNTATRCGFTPQYTELEKIYEKYSAKGLEILDFPCNQFGQQAPGTEEEIHQFCQLNYATKFPQFKKIDVNGDSASPLFTYLKSQKGFDGIDSNHPIGKILVDMLEKSNPDYDKNPDIKWNFTKFLVDREGKVVARYEPTANIADIDGAIADLLK